MPSTSRLHAVQAADEVSRDGVETAARRWPRAFRHLPAALRYILTAGSFGTFGTGCLVGGVAVGVVITLLGIMVTIVLMVAMLGKHGDHSTFNRLMRIICAVTRQPPGDYLA